MRITFLGQAGLFIETRAGTILCDPWFNPAFLASWFPFPRNDNIDPRTIGDPTYLYVSHLHRDHYDPRFLKDHISKEATVLLPAYPLDTLEKEMRSLGFHRFVRPRGLEMVDLGGGLRIAIAALVAPADGPIGDSALVVDDGEVRIFDQNDAHPVDLDPILALGPFDAHFLQFSGANWFPMVYPWPARAKRALIQRKRANDLARAMRYVEAFGARQVIPCAGPPCFLDEELFEYNDLDGQGNSIFFDQTVCLDHLARNGRTDGLLMIPGSMLELGPSHQRLPHPVDDAAVRSIFVDKRAYLRAYQEAQRDRIAQEKASWPTAETDLVAQLREWFVPLLASADRICAGVGARVRLDLGSERVVVDFLERTVHRWSGEDCRYRFEFDRRIAEALVARREPDWESALWLSCRFRADREGPYNEYVYVFFKALSMERIQYVDGYYAEQAGAQELIELDGHLVQRRCPHLKADLARFGQVEDGVLTCTMHGWQFDLETGRCLTSDDRRLYVVPRPGGVRSPTGSV